MLSTSVSLGLCSVGLREDPEGERETDNKDARSVRIIEMLGS